MTTEPRPFVGATYRGFSGPSAARQPAPSPRGRAWPVPRPLAIGVAAALALGLVGGIWARPDLVHPKASAAMRAVTAGEDATPAKMAIELNALPPQPAMKSAGRLDVLSPDLAQSASRPLPVSTPAPVAPAATVDDCANAASASAQMICADPELAADDRELNRAYRRALRAGVPPEQLRMEQRDWLSIREDAARRSSRAVAGLYAQRIDELNRIADDGGDPD